MGYANVSRPMGFKLHQEGGKTHPFVMARPLAAVRQGAAGGNASFDVAIGDAYGIDQNGNAFRAGPNDVVRGIVIGFRFLPNSSVMGGQGPISDDYSANGQTDTIIGVEDPDAMFEVQADTFNASMIGMKVNLADAAPDSGYAQSRQTITTAAVGSQFTCEDIVQSYADNAYGSNPRVFVRMLTTYQE